MKDSWRPKWQNIGTRNWEQIRDAWIAHVPRFPAIAARPDPGLDQLGPLLRIPLDKANERYPDVPGLRANCLWEAVFLFHKCSHTTLAAQRIAQRGMHSWCLFNAYHAAYLGAKGVMALLGVAFPSPNGKQVAIDLFPQPERKRRHTLGAAAFEDFLIIPLAKLEQRRVWEAFRRVLNMSTASCWDTSIRDELYRLDPDQVSPPRNWFLYKNCHWPLEDLALDAPESSLTTLVGTELDVGDQGFLLRLSFSVYRLFEQLMNDLAGYSAPIKQQFQASRCLDPEIPELESYRSFVSQTGLPTPTQN